MVMRQRRPICHSPFSICHYFFPFDGGAAAPVAALATGWPFAGVEPFAGAAAPLAGAVAVAGAAPEAGTAVPATPSAVSSFTALITAALRCATLGRPKTPLESFH